MVCGDIPFRKDSEICNGFLTWRNQVSDDCKDLIRQCLARNGSDRPSLEEILAHQWMRVPPGEEDAARAELNADRHKLASVPDRLVTEAQPKQPRVPLAATKSDHYLQTPSSSASSSAAIYEGAVTERVPHPEIEPCSSNLRLMNAVPIGSPSRRFGGSPRGICFLTPAVPPTPIAPPAPPAPPAPFARPPPPPPVVLASPCSSTRETQQAHQRTGSVGSVCLISAHSSGSSSGYGTSAASPPGSQSTLLGSWVRAKHDIDGPDDRLEWLGRCGMVSVYLQEVVTTSDGVYERTLSRNMLVGRTHGYLSQSIVYLIRH
uniref:non-specific serine/threonine protein kinase n=1 Tax=Heterorhabditis bacteriophora TaxID=37862 RepID=A0A1I7XAF5_HETBA